MYKVKQGFFFYPFIIFSWPYVESYATSNEMSTENNEYGN